MNIHAESVLWTYVFIFIGSKPKSMITSSQYRCMFNYIRNDTNIFKAVIPFYIPKNNA